VRRIRSRLLQPADRLAAARAAPLRYATRCQCAASPSRLRVYCTACGSTCSTAVLCSCMLARDQPQQVVAACVRGLLQHRSGVVDPLCRTTSQAPPRHSACARRHPVYCWACCSLPVTAGYVLMSHDCSSAAQAAKHVVYWYYIMQFNQAKGAR
jgi:hypothetical protein